VTVMGVMGVVMAGAGAGEGETWEAGGYLLLATLDACLAPWGCHCVPRESNRLGYPLGVGWTEAALHNRSLSIGENRHIWVKRKLEARHESGEKPP
jgi:hypothetical protein